MQGKTWQVNTICESIGEAAHDRVNYDDMTYWSLFGEYFEVFQIEGVVFWHVLIIYCKRVTEFHIALRLHQVNDMLCVVFLTGLPSYELEFFSQKAHHFPEVFPKANKDL